MDYLTPFLKYGLILAFIVVVALVSMVLFGHDNTIEEAAEDIFEHKTGHKMDFSPGEDGKPVEAEKRAK